MSAADQATGEAVELRVMLDPAAARALRRVMAVTGWGADEVVNRALPRFAQACDWAEAYRLEAEMARKP